MSVSFDFTDKVVLITGSSSGIGAATAVLFSKSGAKVVVTGRKADKVAEVAEQCLKESPNGYKALQVIADVTKEEDLKLLVECTIDEFGQLDVLVNNAGFVRPTQIADSDYLQAFKSVIDTNLISVVYLTSLCVEYLAKTKGNIVNNSSVAAYIAWKKFTPYSVSKSALDMFTKCSAVELGPLGIRVNSVNPGVVRTLVFENTGLDKPTADHVIDCFGSQYPVGRAGYLEEVANAILYLACDQSAFITGTNMIVDGGHTSANVTVDL